MLQENIFKYHLTEKNRRSEIIYRGTRDPIFDYAVIRRGIASGLQHFLFSPTSANQPIQKNFQKITHQQLLQMRIPEPDNVGKEKKTKWIIADCALSNFQIVALISEKTTGLISVLHDAYVFDKVKGEAEKFSLDKFLEVFSIPPSEKQTIYKAAMGEIAHWKRSKKRPSNDKIFYPELKKVKQKGIIPLLTTLANKYGTNEASSFAQSLNEGRIPESNQVAMTHLVDVEEGLTCDQRLSAVDIPVFDFDLDSNSSHTNIDGNNSFLSPNGRLRIPIHPVTLKSIKYKATQIGNIITRPTGGTRTLMIHDTSLPGFEAGDQIKLSLKARISNENRMIPDKDVLAIRAASHVLKEQIAKNPPPAGVSFVLDSEIATVKVDGIDVVVIKRKKPLIDKDEITVPGYALYTDLPEPYGHKPLLIQIIDQMLEKVKPIDQEIEILNLTKNTIVDPIVQAFEYALNCKGEYTDPTSQKKVIINGIPIEPHAQNVEWIIKISDEGALIITPKVLIKDFGDYGPIQDMNEPKKVAERLSKQWDIRLGDFLMEPIFNALSKYFNIPIEKLRKLLIESFQQNISVQNKKLFIEDENVVAQMGNDTFVRTFFRLAGTKSVPMAKILTWPPIYRPSEVMDYISK